MIIQDSTDSDFQDIVTKKETTRIEEIIHKIHMNSKIEAYLATDLIDQAPGIQIGESHAQKTVRGISDGMNAHATIRVFTIYNRLVSSVMSMPYLTKDVAQL